MPKSKSNQKILIFTTAEGHLSIAQAAKDALSNYQVKLVNFPLGNAFKFYQPFYLYFPSLFKYPYKLNEKEKVIELLFKVYEKALSKKIKKEIVHFKPDLVISTYGILNQMIVSFLRDQVKNIPFINIISDPRTFPDFYISRPANYNLLYESLENKRIKKLALKHHKQQAIGWLSQKKYMQKKPSNHIYKKLEFNEKILTFLICGGSAGTNAIVKILPALLLAQKPLQVIVVCGHNKSLLKNLKKLNNFYQKIRRSNTKISNKINKRVKLKLLGYENNLAQFMQISNLIIGKAGPNLLFESISCYNPFSILISHSL